MKIMILANSSSGLYEFRGELLEKLLEQHQVMICVPAGDYIEEMQAIGCEFIPCELLDRHGINPVQELKLVSFYENVLREKCPNIVFTYTIKPNIYGGMVCSKLGIPYAANITGLGTAVENGGLMQKLTIALYRLGLKKARKVFFQNAENRDFMLSKKVVRGAYELLPGSGVNLDKFCVQEYPDTDTIDFVFVGRVMREKGIDQYFEAAEYIREKYPQTRFHVCGAFEQDYRKRLYDLHDRGIVNYHGKVKNMKSIYQMVSCTIHPSFYPEGLSNVLLESCASGRPIITTDRAGCREVLEEGVNGFLCKQKDSQDLIKQIERFLNLSWKERRDMGIAGRRKVEKEFNRQIVIEKYLQEVK